MEGELTGLLEAGQAAAGSGAWPAARAAFEAALALDGDRAEALLGLGDCLWWEGETVAAVATTERAYTAFRRRPDPATATLAAVGLYFIYRVSLGNVAASRGWMRRAATLVDDHGLEDLAGWILLMRAHDSADPAVSESWARKAHDLARAGGDIDLELCALSQIGASLVGLGRVDEGTALLDEAMAASLAGEARRLDTVVYTNCSMVMACAQVAEFSRVVQWIRASDGFASRYGCPHLFTVCRTYCGAALAANGQWEKAEAELEGALRLGRTAEPGVVGEAVAHLAELRLAQGRIEEAEALVSGYADHAATVPITAALHLVRGRPGPAALLARRRLNDMDSEELAGAPRVGASLLLERAALLEMVVEAEVARGGLDAAAAAAEELAELGAALAWPPLVAAGERSQGRVLIAKADYTAATARLERALAVYARLARPVQAARTRVLLAEALAPAERQGAVAEARAALTAFEALGAHRDADHAAALLRSLGERASRSGPRRVGGLSRREAEVFALVGEGLSNRQIAERLFVAVKTVEHHVASIFTKLGVASRAEAAALAARQPPSG